MVDTDGRGLILQVHAASVQDRDGAIPLLQASRALYPFIERVFADSAYAADRVAIATKIIVEIVRKQAGQIGFAVHPRRWVVERFLAWLGRNRASPRTSKERSSRQQPSSMPLPSSAHTTTCSFGLNLSLIFDSPGRRSRRQMSTPIDKYYSPTIMWSSGGTRR